MAESMLLLENNTCLFIRKKSAFIDLDLLSPVRLISGSNYRLYEYDNKLYFDIDLSARRNSPSATAGSYDINLLFQNVDKLKGLRIHEPQIINGFKKEINFLRKHNWNITLRLLFPKGVIVKNFKIEINRNIRLISCY